MAHKGSWWLSMSSVTSMLVASQLVHQLVSLCFICKCHFTRAVGHSRPCVLRTYCSSSPVTPPEESGNGPGMQWLSRLIAYSFHRDTLQRETAMFIMGYRFLYPLRPCYGCPWKTNKRQKVNWDRVIMGFMYFFFNGSFPPSIQQVRWNLPILGCGPLWRLVVMDIARARGTW